MLLSKRVLFTCARANHSCFLEDINKLGRIFLSKLECDSQEINSREIRLHFTFSAKWKKPDRLPAQGNLRQRRSQPTATATLVLSDKLELTPLLHPPPAPSPKSFLVTGGFQDTSCGIHKTLFAVAETMATESVQLERWLLVEIRYTAIVFRYLEKRLTEEH